MSLPDCRGCGVCCFSALDTYVPVSGDDWTRLGNEAEERAHFIGHRAFLKMHDGHCAALEIRRSADGTADFFCSIYEHRPRVCRDLARGSAQCDGELAVKAARVAQLRSPARGSFAKTSTAWPGASTSK